RRTRRSPSPHHQTGSGQDAPPVRCFTRLVYRDGETEVVAGDDKLSHDCPPSLGTRRPSLVRLKFAPRQVTVRVVMARNQKTSPATSRMGNSAKLLTPSRSWQPHPRI